MIITTGHTGQLLLVLLIVFLIGGLPAWPCSRSWGYAPTGIFSTVLAVLVIFMLLGRV
jgi:hypothetical protein